MAKETDEKPSSNNILPEHILPDQIIPDELIRKGVIPTNMMSEEAQKELQEHLAALTRRETIKYIAACLLFGSLTFSSRHTSVGPLQLTFLRVFTGTFFLMIVFCCSKFRATLWDYTTKQLMFLIVSGVCIGVTWLILADSGKKLGVTEATLTYSLGPGLLLVLSPFLFKEAQLTKSKVVGFIICTIGIFIMDFEWFLTPHGWDAIFDVLVAAVFTVVVVYCNRQLEGINGLENAMFQMIISFGIIFVIYVWKHGFYFEVPEPDSWWIMFAGILNTGLPVYLYLSSVDELRADIIAFAGYIRPITTMFISVYFFGEHLEVETIIGAICILGGVAVANFFRRKNLTKNRNF